MENIIKEYVFSVDFEKDIFQTLKEVELVENDNKSTKFIFNFINNITDGENVLLKINTISKLYSLVYKIFYNASNLCHFCFF